MDEHIELIEGVADKKSHGLLKLVKYLKKTSTFKTDGLKKCLCNIKVVCWE